MPGSEHMKGVSPKRNRQYEHIKDSLLESGKSEEEAKEEAARTVNKQRAEHGETKKAADSWQLKRYPDKYAQSGEEGYDPSNRATWTLPAPGSDVTNYVTHPGNGFVTSWKDSDPSKITLTAGDMPYHQFSYQNLADHGADKLAQILDETGAQREIRDALDATHKLHPGSQTQMSLFSKDKKHWIQDAVKKPGQLHKDLGVPEGEKIPEDKLEEAEHSDSKKVRERAQFAENMKKIHSKWHLAVGGLCPQCTKPMVGNDCPSCGYADQMGATDQGYSPGANTGLSPNPDVMPASFMARRAKWHLALGEQQQPSAVASPPQLPVPDNGSEYHGMDDVSSMSLEQEMAFQKWVDYAVDQLNKGRPESEILAQLAHDGCDDPQAVLARALEQPINTDGNLQDSPPPEPVQQEPMVNDSTASGAGSVGQPPAFQASVKGTDIVGTVEAQWEDLYGRPLSRISTDTGRYDVLTDDIEPHVQREVDPLSIVHELIDGLPPLEQTKSSIQNRIEHLKTAARICRKAACGDNVTNDQIVKIGEIEKSCQLAILNLTNDLEKYRPNLDEYLASQRPYHIDGYGIEEMLVKEGQVSVAAYDRIMDEHPKLVVHDLSVEERMDPFVVRRAASDYISQYIWELPPSTRRELTDQFVETALSEARSTLPEAHTPKTAAVETEDISLHDGPSSQLFI